MKGTKKCHKNTKFKPFWDRELNDKWQTMHENERVYRNSLKNKPRNMLKITILKQAFVKSRQFFDRSYKHICVEY